MIVYAVPLARFPDTYNGHPIGVAALAAQRHYNSVYLMAVYGDPATRKAFHAAYKKSGKRLDMGESCVRFRRAQDLPLDVIGAAVGRFTVDEFVAQYHRGRSSR